MKKLLPFLLLLAAASASAATMYRWVDADGKVHYTDQPPPPTAKGVQEKKLGAAPASGGDNLPYAVKVAAQKYPVVLYVTDCGEPCDKARAHLAKRGVPHSEKNPTNETEAEALKKLTGSREVPVLVVGGSITRGYEAASWDAALDAAGYPKSAFLPKAVPKKPEATPSKPAAETPASK